MAVRVQAVAHRYFLFSSLAMIALVGVAGGWLAAVILELRLTQPVTTGETAQIAKVDNITQQSLAHYQIILDRNIFDSANRGGTFLTEEAPLSASPAESPPKTETHSASTGRKDLALIGTVTAGPDSLAVIDEGGKTSVYRLGEEIGNAALEEIARNHVVLRNQDGTLENLVVATESGVAAPTPARADPEAAPGAAKSEIKQVGENRWLIPQETAERARGNINDLLKTARLEPRIVRGKTNGFVVSMLRPGSFLDLLGLSRKDVVMEINNVALNSPERALQIMQQLREARHIRVSILRDNQPMTFEYEIN